MARTLEILTPESIPLTLEPAGIATRLGANLIDIAVQVGIFALGAILFGLLSLWARALTESTVIQAAAIIAGFLLMFGYHILFETVWNGQTPGKRVFGIRVVRDGGLPVDFFSVATRNLVRIADFLPLVYGFGASAIFLSPQYKRLGDMAAGTIVIRERQAKTLGFAWKRKPDATAVGIAQFKAARLPDAVRPPIDALNGSEQALIRRFALRRWEMTPDDAERLGYRIVVPLVAKLNLVFVAGAAPHYADLVSTIVADLDRAQEERDAGRTL